MVQDRAVYMEKTCPDHGVSLVYLWPDVDHFNWIRTFPHPLRNAKGAQSSSDHCPTSCGLCSLHQRHATLIELEVTHRCNLHCPVCFMSAQAAAPEPTLSELKRILTDILKKSSRETSLQLTGGEPTTREDLPEIVRACREIGFHSIEINTNGLVISRKPEFLGRLKDAGICGIYLQFDGLSPDVYSSLRGRDLLAEKLQAIENCRAAGLPVVLAMTIVPGINDEQMGAVLNFGLDNLDVVCGIALQPAFTSGRFEVQRQRPLTMGDVAFMLAEQTHGLIQPYELWPLGCSHPLCSSGTHLIEDGSGYIPVTREISRDEYLAAYDPRSPQGSIFADLLAKKNRPSRPGLSVLVMNYMDALSMDIDRLKACSMTVATDDDRLIPFCSYQVTNTAGLRLYPAWLEKEDVLQEGQHGTG